MFSLAWLGILLLFSNFVKPAELLLSHAQWEVMLRRCHELHENINLAAVCSQKSS
jgi:hypothetical protein